MSVNIGIFEKEADVVEAIRLLREAGVDHDEMRVIVKNADAAPLITSTTDVPVEELAGLQEAGERETGIAGGWPVLAAVPNNSLGNGTTANPPGVIVGAFHPENEENFSGGVMREVGIPNHASERCGEEVDAGRILLCMEADDSTNAATILRHAGAADVLH
ncbi:MAG: hypothetical protein JWR03_1657 [Cohnella sp.]|nr:hypothetical protein [Cohnella sp.]